MEEGCARINRHRSKVAMARGSATDGFKRRSGAAIGIERHRALGLQYARAENRAAVIDTSVLEYERIRQ